MHRSYGWRYNNKSAVRPRWLILNQVMFPLSSFVQSHPCCVNSALITFHITDLHVPLIIFALRFFRTWKLAQRFTVWISCIINQWKESCCTHTHTHTHTHAVALMAKTSCFFILTAFHLKKKFLLLWSSHRKCNLIVSDVNADCFCLAEENSYASWIFLVTFCRYYSFNDDKKKAKMSKRHGEAVC